MKNYFKILGVLSTRLATHVDKSVAPQASRLIVIFYRATVGAVWGVVWGPACRFTPSCSEYAEECYRTLGWRQATGMGVRRLLRCHPFHEGGFDPV